MRSVFNHKKTYPPSYCLRISYYTTISFKKYKSCEIKKQVLTTIKMERVQIKNEYNS